MYSMLLNNTASVQVKTSSLCVRACASSGHLYFGDVVIVEGSELEVLESIDVADLADVLTVQVQRRNLP